MLRRLLPALCAACLLAPATAAAAAPSFPIYGGFHSVLAFGEGDSTSAQDLAAFFAHGTVPAADLNQDHMYEGLEQAWPGFTDAALNTYYKNSEFAAEPAPSTLSGLLGSAGSVLSGSPANVETPESGLTIVRNSYGVPAIYGTTRAEAMWGAGYATAESRLFFMDVLRHTAEGTTAELLGASAASSDSTQLGQQDASPAQLTAQVQALPQTMGAEGAQALADLQQYVAGVNAFINLTKIDPARLPAEYAALGITPQPWTLADSAAVGTYLVGEFTVFGGEQPQQAEALRMAEARLGKRAGTAVYDDLRLAADPEAVVTLTKRFHGQALGKLNAKSEAMIDPGSLRPRNAVTGGPGQAAAAQSASRLPGWARTLAVHGLRLSHLQSNAVLVDAQRSGTGQALAVMGPQVGYYTPEILFEYEMHAPGISVSGVAFPGSSPYPLIGHGTDFAWTGTSANSANEDVFAEKLCNPGGGRASLSSGDYLYRGHCIPFSSRAVVETTPPPAQTVTLHTLNSVHGPITSYATVHGVPVALATAAATAGHEADSYVAFMRLAEDEPTSPQSFVAAMRAYPGSENWFYVDDKNIAVLQSGWFPEHARGSNPDLPIWGTGQWNWRGFNPSSDGYDRLPAADNPTSIDPKQGYLVNWNNAIAHGWPVAAGDWSNGPVVRATMLQDLLNGALRTRHVTLASLTGMVTAPAMTSDLRGMAVWPYLRQVIGTHTSAQVRSLVALLRGWAINGSQRRSTQVANVVDDSPAVLLMDTWWPLLVRAEFQPAVGAPLVNLIDANFDSIVPSGLRSGTADAFFSGWEMDVQKDMRQVLHSRVRGRFSRSFCGRGSLKRCRAILTRTLVQAAAQLTQRYGAMANWKLPVTCAVTTPAGCDQIVPTSAGAISVPPQPFENRGTFYQAVAVSGHRP